ncbi:MAG TPA: hypothetical protein VLS90_00160, partial [Thermodesulfobacteriota bacterium]|nr:hypothetical protein [Thermodesulfobacteriota bacterium]
PALLTHGVWWEVVLFSGFAVVGIYYLGSAMEGYLWKIGPIGWPARLPLIVGGLLIAFPEMITTIVGLAVVSVVNISCYLAIRRSAPPRVSPGV